MDLCESHLPSPLDECPEHKRGLGQGQGMVLLSQFEEDLSLGGRRGGGRQGEAAVGRYGIRGGAELFTNQDQNVPIHLVQFHASIWAFSTK